MRSAPAPGWTPSRCSEHGSVSPPTNRAANHARRIDAVVAPVILTRSAGAISSSIPRLPPETYTAPNAIADSSRMVVCCLLYTSDAADDLLCVDLGGRRII